MINQIEMTRLTSYLTPEELAELDGLLQPSDWTGGAVNVLNLPAYGLNWSPYWGMQTDMLSLLNVATIDNPLAPVTIKNKPKIIRLPGGRKHYERFGLQSGESPFIIFAGGAAGPGKTDCLVLGALAQVYHPEYRAVIFRRTYPALSEGGGIVDRTHDYYPALGAEYNQTRHVWTFPTGAKIYLRHMQHEKDMLKYQGSQYAFVGFDELTEFELKMFTYMFGRARAKRETGLRHFIVATSNPGGIGHEWVKQMFITSGITCKVDYFVRQDNEDKQAAREYPDSQGRIFIPGTIADNPSLPDVYVAQLRQQDKVQQARYLAGDWDANYDADNVYPNWNSQENVTSVAAYDPELPVFWTCDDGYRPNPRVVLFYQITTDDTIHIFDELYQTEKLHRETIETAQAMNYPAPETIYVDPSALTFMAELRRQEFTSRTNIIGAYNDIADGVKAVRREIYDGKGERKLLVHPKCTNFIREIVSYRYDEKAKLPNGDPRPVKEHDHGPDAIRYMIATTRAYRM